MKIMNVLATNYNSQKNQPSFGMVFELTPKAAKMFHPDDLERIKATIKPIKTKSGKEIFVKGKFKSAKDESISLTAYIDDGNKKINEAIVSKQIGKSTYHDYYTSNDFNELTMYALLKIKEGFDSLDGIAKIFEETSESFFKGINKVNRRK